MALFAIEISLRRQAGLQPDSLKNFLKWGQKRQSPHPRYSALIFAMTAVYFFQVWEAFVRFLFQQQPFWPFVIGGAALLLVLLIKRARPAAESGAANLRPLGLYWLLSVFVGFSVMLQAWGMLLTLPWLFYRGRFLAKSF